MVNTNYIIDNFIKKLYQRRKPSLAFKVKTKEEFSSCQKELKEKIKELLGGWPEPAGEVMATIAPKPLLIESGASDTCFYLGSARKAHQIVKKAYKIAGVEDNLWIEVFPGEHSFSGRKAFDFFKKCLG